VKTTASNVLTVLLSLSLMTCIYPAGSLLHSGLNPHRAFAIVESYQAVSKNKNGGKF
jgi:hypothetical protein